MITATPKLVMPVPGEWPLIHQLIFGMFAEEAFDQRPQLFGWLSAALHALHAKTRKPGQVLVVAGPAECGKSLLQSLITWMIGGRESKPYSYMTGRTDFNSDLFATEHLRLDDEQASTDPRARRAFGARVKELLFGHAQRMHQKHRDPITLDPIWRMSISLNEEPEALQVLPPLDESLEDKFIILRAAKKPMPMPTRTTEESAAFAQALRDELPMFIHYLMNDFEIPESLRNARCGIAHWHHPELLTAIHELSPSSRLLSLIDMELFHHQGTTPHWEGTADQLEHELLSQASSVRGEAQKLLTWSNACGTYLGRIAKQVPDRVEKVRVHASREWRILPPRDENS